MSGSIGKQEVTEVASAQDLADIYSAMIYRIRFTLGGRQAPGTVLKDGEIWERVSLDLLCEAAGITPSVALHFSRYNAYVAAFEVDKKLYVLETAPAKSSPDYASWRKRPDIMSGARNPLGFGGEYGDLGWSDGRGMPTGLPLVLGALKACSGGAPSEKDMIQIIIGFCEAARFLDIQKLVIKGGTVDRDSLDWTKFGRHPSDLFLKPGNRDPAPSGGAKKK